METIKKLKSFLSTLFIRTLFVLGALVLVILIKNPVCGLAAIISFVERPYNVDNVPKYSEIYNCIFEVQQDLILCQWVDTKRIILRKRNFESCCQEIAKVEKGTLLQVKKVIQNHKYFTGDELRILVEIKDPKFSEYKINSRMAINAIHLIADNRFNEKIQFDSEFLKKIEQQ